MKIAIRRSQKINSRIHNSRIAIRQRIAQLGFCVVYQFFFDYLDSFVKTRYCDIPFMIASEIIKCLLYTKLHFIKFNKICITHF